METITIDGVGYQVDAQTAQAYRKHVADSDAAAKEGKKALDIQTARADAAEEERDAEKKKGEDQKKEHDSVAGDEAIRKRVDARVKLVTDAAAVLEAKKATKDKDGKDIDLTTMDDADIRALVIKAASPDRNLDGKTTDYVEAAFEMIVDSASRETNKDAAAKNSRDSIQTAAASTVNTDDGEPDADKSRAKMMDSLTNRWQQKPEAAKTE